MRVAYPAPAGAFLPLWAAQDAGIFKKHGLQVELIAVGSSTRGIAAIVSGDLDILAGGGSSGVTSQLQGYSDMALFANVIQSFLFSVMVQPSITEVAQLRGKRMGVTRFGGTLDFVARQYVKRQGMEPGKDVTFVQIGAMPDIVVSVLTGAIESGVIGIPQNFLAKKQGPARTGGSVRERFALCYRGLCRQAQFPGGKSRAHGALHQGAGGVDSLSQDAAQRGHGNL